MESRRCPTPRTKAPSGPISRLLQALQPSDAQPVPSSHNLLNLQGRSSKRLRKSPKHLTECFVFDNPTSPPVRGTEAQTPDPSCDRITHLDRCGPAQCSLLMMWLACLGAAPSTTSPSLSTCTSTSVSSPCQLSHRWCYTRLAKTSATSAAAVATSLPGRPPSCL